MTISKKPPASPRAKLYKFLELCGPWIFMGIVLAFLALGWKMRSFKLITPQYGIGYIFGIVGVSLMIILMLYPLRKRLPVMANLGNVKVWFRNHMLLGIIGPMFVLYHCNFELGSLNSNVALISMLVVAGSGVFGRFIYKKIHYGLYGQRATVVNLKETISNHKAEIYPHIQAYPVIRPKLIAFVDEILNQEPTFLNHLMNLCFFRYRAGVLYFQLAAQAKTGETKEALPQRKALVREMGQILNETVKLAEYFFYARSFSVWHLLHVPLVFIMFITIIIHVIVVHLY